MAQRRSQYQSTLPTIEMENRDKVVAYSIPNSLIRSYMTQAMPHSQATIVCPRRVFSGIEIA
jgi:hypothetical protein